LLEDFLPWNSPEASVGILLAQGLGPWFLRHEWFGYGSRSSPIHGNRRGLPVITPAAFRVPQHIIGFPQFKKWAAFQPGSVGMQFHGAPPECRFDVLAAGIGGNAEHQVIILRHGSWDCGKCEHPRWERLKFVERTGDVARSVKSPIRPGEKARGRLLTGAGQNGVGGEHIFFTRRVAISLERTRGAFGN